MQLKITKQTLSEVKKDYVRVSFIEKGSEHFIEREGVTELHIVSGKLGKLTPRTFRTLVREIVMSTKRHKIAKIALSFDTTKLTGLKDYKADWMWQTIAENIQLANYEFTKYKSKAPKTILTEILITDVDDKKITKWILNGEVVATYANHCRDIANTSGGDMTPALLGDAAKRVLKGTKATVKILDDKAIAKLKMGGLLGVGQGALHKPRFIIVEYNGTKGSKTKKGPLVFVGKGITFDTGGLQVKPGMSMYEMHMDMSGGAAVIAAVGAIAKLELPQHVIGLIPAAENAVSGTAMRPGDVLTMMSGTTVDVLHTDAEGRLVLGDALHYARQFKPRLVIDVATLTGAALVAVGQHAHVIMTKDRELEDTLRELGEESGDYTFPLPLWDEYKQYTKGVNADITNVPVGDSRYGGSINGGMFLSHFTKGLKWAHIDMAPRMTSVNSDKLAKGATGEPVRLLVKIAEKL
jgi:leucyl aminopeptidase